MMIQEREIVRGTYTAGARNYTAGARKNIVAAYYFHFTNYICAG